MPNVPNLLNDDGSASMATALMMSHHAFRRDLSRFGRALAQIAAGDASRIGAVHDEWLKFHAALHGHHEAEDNGVFPDLGSQHASMGYERHRPRRAGTSVRDASRDSAHETPRRARRLRSAGERVWGSAKAGAATTPIPDDAV